MSQNQENYINLCKILKETQQQNRINQIVKLIEVDTQEVSALYEYYDIILREISNEISINFLFVLKSLSEGLSELYTNNQDNGNLTLDFVLVDKSKGEMLQMKPQMNLVQEMVSFLQELKQYQQYQQ